MTIDYDKVYAEAKRLSAERGHTPDLTDLDKIIEDAVDLAITTVSTDDVLRMLDTLIAPALAEEGERPEKLLAPAFGAEI